MKKTNLRTLTECSIMIALATVLSLIKLVDYPAGGSVTLASMLPITVIAYRHGLKWGLSTATVTGVLQMLLGLSSFSYVTTWQSVVAVALLDYIVAFSVYGLAGVFRGRFGSQSLELTLGASLCALLRYICHVISGCTVWAGLSIPTEAALVYSIGYNATYMLPDTIILALVAGYLAMALDFRTPTPARLQLEHIDRRAEILLFSAGGVILAGLIADVLLVFSKLQSEEGDFFIEGLKNVNWLAFGIVTAATAAVAVTLYLLATKKKKS